MDEKNLFEKHFMNKTILGTKKRIGNISEFIKEKKIKIKNIYDIGANIGIYSIYYALNFKEANIYSFEPVESTYNILEKNVNNFNLNQRIHIYNYGISINNKKEKLYLSIPENRDSENIGLYSLKVKDECKKDSILANFRPLNKFNIPTPDFIKIDVEGCEEEIIKNNLDIFNQAKLLYIEIIPTRFSGEDSYIKNNQTIYDTLEKLNFIQIGKYGNNDYLFIKKNLK